MRHCVDYAQLIETLCIVDEKGDSLRGKADIGAVYAHTDDEYLYLMIEFYTLDDLHHVEVDFDIDGDDEGELMCAFGVKGRDASACWVELQDLRGSSAILYAPRVSYPQGASCFLNSVYEIKMPLSFIENTQEFFMRLRLMQCQGEDCETIDETEYVYVEQKRSLGFIEKCPEQKIGTRAFLMFLGLALLLHLKRKLLLQYLK